MRVDPAGFDADELVSGDSREHHTSCRFWLMMSCEWMIHEVWLQPQAVRKLQAKLFLTRYGLWRESLAGKLSGP